VKDGLGRKDVGARPRSRATTRVTEPRLTVAEGTEMADPAALDEVLELLVTWAIRAHGVRCSAANDSVTYDLERTYEGSN